MKRLPKLLEQVAAKNEEGETMIDDGAQAAATRLHQPPPVSTNHHLFAQKPPVSIN
jgi:hypothetical protein